MKFDSARLSQLLRDTRTEKRLSLREVADQTGISASTISRIENDHIPDMESFMALCEWLVMLPSEFFLVAEGLSVPVTYQRLLEKEVDYRIDNAIENLNRAVRNLESIRGNYRTEKKE